jgi:outer membrane protein OmpA-like peptidoglycan-associated protein
MRRELFVIPIAVVALVGTTGCATKKYVNTNVAEASEKINGRIDAVSKSVEETQERTRQNETRIKEVDQKASAADEKAGAAGRAAADARSTADAAMTKTDALDRATKKLVFEVVLSEAQGNFKFGKADLTDEMKSELDKLVERLKADPQAIYLEIEGHTDSTGPAELNKELGLERAEAVRQYLYEQHQIPLQKISVISYGEEKPVAPNDTAKGRAENRRVVIKVLA